MYYLNAYNSEFAMTLIMLVSNGFLLAQQIANVQNQSPLGKMKRG